MKRYDKVSAFILCGGASSRMGQPKGLLELGGQALVLRLARLVEPLVSAVTLVGPEKQYARLGLEVIEDGQFGGSDNSATMPGPLAGIATALAASRTQWNLIVACDLPYLTAEWVDWILSRTATSDAQMVVPRTAGGLEPLAAAYRKECGEPITAALRRGTRKVSEGIESLRIEFVTESEWHHIDPDGRVLRNMNTPDDYAQARTWFENRPS